MCLARKNVLKTRLSNSMLGARSYTFGTC